MTPDGSSAVLSVHSKVVTFLAFFLLLRKTALLHLLTMLVCSFVLVDRATKVEGVSFVLELDGCQAVKCSLSLCFINK